MAVGVQQAFQEGMAVSSVLRGKMEKGITKFRESVFPTETYTEAKKGLRSRLALEIGMNEILEARGLTREGFRAYQDDVLGKFRPGYNDSVRDGVGYSTKREPHGYYGTFISGKTLFDWAPAGSNKSVEKWQRKLGARDTSKDGQYARAYDEISGLSGDIWSFEQARAGKGYARCDLELCQRLYSDAEAQLGAFVGDVQTASRFGITGKDGKPIARTEDNYMAYDTLYQYCKDKEATGFKLSCDMVPPVQKGFDRSNPFPELESQAEEQCISL